MKILHLIYTNGIAGAEKHLLDLLPGLKKQGIDCEFICVGPANYKASVNNYCNLMISRGIKTTIFFSAGYFENIVIAKKISRYIKANNITIIHSHLFMGDLIAVLIKTLYNKSIRIISTKHGYNEDYLIKYGSGDKRIPKNFYYLASKVIIKRIDENIAASQFIADMYSNLKLGNKMKFIHHGIDVTPADASNNGTESSPKIMIVGRLVKVKGHKFLLDAMPLVLAKFPTLTLLILGTGIIKDELQQQADELGLSDHVQFLGFQKPEEFTPGCQVIIIPSLFEAFGMVFIEAFALKIPIVAFDVGAGNELIKNNETGLLVPPFNTGKLAEKIIFLLQNPNERSRIAENAYNTYKAGFTTQKMVAETADWYKSLP